MLGGHLVILKEMLLVYKLQPKMDSSYNSVEKLVENMVGTPGHFTSHFIINSKLLYKNHISVVCSTVTKG